MNKKNFCFLFHLAMRVAIDSASSQPDLAEPLAKKGYNSTEMANAKVLFT